MSSGRAGGVVPLSAVAAVVLLACGGGGGGGRPAGGCDADLTSDPRNCGACGVVCDGGSCSEGRCATPPPATYALTVQKNVASGTVTGDGIDCGATCARSALTAGTTVTLSAAAAPGGGFAGWTGCDGVEGATCTLTMTADRTVSATFTSGMPTPPGPVVPRPAGTPGNLHVLDWAGFRSATSYSFDDSSTSQIEHYSSLNALGIRLSFYAIGQEATTQASFWRQVAKDGHELANHTWSHHGVASVTDAEIDDCTSFLLEDLGVSGVWTMAGPYGGAGWGAYARPRFLLNRGVSNGMIAPNDSTDPFDLPVYIPPAAPRASGLVAVTDTAHASGSWVIVLVHGFAGGSDHAYQPVDVTDFLGGVQYAMGLGDVWLDSVVNVGAYWRAQEMLSSVVPIVSGTTQTWTWTLPAHFPPGRFLRVKVDGGTLRQGANVLAWDPRGYYEVALDVGSLTLTP